MIASPCVKICVMDAERRYCAGCGRTLDEIARWGEMEDGERLRVLAQLAARRSTAPSQVIEAPAAPLA